MPLAVGEVLFSYHASVLLPALTTFQLGEMHLCRCRILSIFLLSQQQKTGNIIIHCTNCSKTLKFYEAFKKAPWHIKVDILSHIMEHFSYISKQIIRIKWCQVTLHLCHEQHHNLSLL
jgi:hypothetical protein